MKTRTSLLVSTSVGAFIGFYMSSPFWIEAWVTYPWIESHEKFFFWALSKQSIDSVWYQILNWPAGALTWLWATSGLPCIPGRGEFGGLMNQIIISILVEWLLVGLIFGFFFQWLINRKAHPKQASEPARPGADGQGP
jgi:hypothetical protein